MRRDARLLLVLSLVGDGDLRPSEDVGVVGGRVRFLRLCYLLVPDLLYHLPLLVRLVMLREEMMRD